MSLFVPHWGSLTRSVLFLIAATLLFQACGDDPDTMLYLNISKDPDIVEDIERLTFMVKKEEFDGSKRQVSEEDNDFSSQLPVLVGIENIIIDSNLYVHILGYDQANQLKAIYSGEITVAPGEIMEVSLHSYKAECDLDGDSFYACLDGEGNPNGCCDHLAPELLDHFDDKADSAEDLEAAYTAFLTQSSGLELFCREVLLSTQPEMIHPFTKRNFEESEPCYCGNLVDEDCYNGDFVCDDTDNDGDTWINGWDCNDNDPTIYPGALEVAGDGVDNNCNDIIDTDASNCDIDLDQDGFCGGDGGEDCNDRDRNIHPGLIDIPNDGIDQDCDGVYNTIILDNDVDRDQHVNIDFGGDDCDDTDAGIFPGAPDLCSDGIDQDCSGEDLPCVANDLDRDGYVDIQAGGRDCDDSNPLIFPGAPDLCNDNIDQDCAGGDEDCDDDHDQDNYNILWDCDDTDPEVYPGAEEFCNGRDDDCDGLVDEGNPLYLRSNHEEAPLFCGDTDEGECELGKSVCTQPQNQQYRGFNCFGEIEPSEEVCDNLDNDCDGEIDNGNPGGGDACVAECGAGTQVCTRGEFICRSQDAEPEACDGEDNDCDGAIDESEENPEQPLFETCYTGPQGTLWIGQCEQGVSVCEDGEFSACDGDIVPTPEGCDNVEQDNDCNGIVDDFEPPTEPCNTGLLEFAQLVTGGVREPPSPASQTINPALRDAIIWMRTTTATESPIISKPLKMSAIQVYPVPAVLAISTVHPRVLLSVARRFSLSSNHAKTPEQTTTVITGSTTFPSLVIPVTLPDFPEYAEREPTDAKTNSWCV